MSDQLQSPRERAADDRLLVPGSTCTQTARANRYTPVVDGADYLVAVKAAMLRAERRIMLIGWDLDSQTAFEPEGPTLSGPDHLGMFLHWLLLSRRDLQVYLLKSNLRLLPAFDGFWFGVAPVALLNQITSSRMHFAVDGARPTGAVHHQKIVVIDDAMAFCGGIDLTVGRWDTRAHLPDDPGRQTAGRALRPPPRGRRSGGRPGRAGAGRAGPGPVAGRDRSVAVAGVAARTGVAATVAARAARRRGRGRPHASDVARPSGGPRGRGAGLRRDRRRTRGDLSGEPVPRGPRAGRGARGAAARTRGARSRDRVAAHLGEPAGAAVDGQRAGAAAAPAVGRRRARPARRVLACGQGRRVGVRALEGDGDRRPVAADRLVEPQQPVAGFRQRMRRRAGGLAGRPRRRPAPHRRHPRRPGLRAPRCAAAGLPARGVAAQLIPGGRRGVSAARAGRCAGSPTSWWPRTRAHWPRTN